MRNQTTDNWSALHNLQQGLKAVECRPVVNKIEGSRSADPEDWWHIAAPAAALKIACP